MASLGEKRTCPACSAKFYDLGKDPCTCPKCGNKYSPKVEEAPKQKRGKAKRVEDFKDDKAKKTAEKKKAAKVALGDDELGGLDLSEFGDAEEAGAAGDELVDALEADDNVESLSDLEEREREEESVDGDENDEESLLEKLEDEADILDEPHDEDEEDEDDSEDEDYDDEEDGTRMSVQRKRRKNAVN